MNNTKLKLKESERIMLEVLRHPCKFFSFLISEVKEHSMFSSLRDCFLQGVILTVKTNVA